MSEARLWQRVRTALHDPPRHVCRKLTDAFTAGTPDAFFVAEGITTFLELKYDAWPKRPTTPVHCDVSAEQRAYLTMLRAARAPAWVLLGVGQDLFILDHALLPEAKGPKRNQIRLSSDGLRGLVFAPEVAARCRLADLGATLQRLALSTVNG